MRQVGTVVFTVSAQFGVPVTNTWASTRGDYKLRAQNSRPHQLKLKALGHEVGSAKSAMGHSATFGATLAEVRFVADLSRGDTDVR